MRHLTWPLIQRVYPFGSQCHRNSLVQPTTLQVDWSYPNLSLCWPINLHFTRDLINQHCSNLPCQPSWTSSLEQTSPHTWVSDQYSPIVFNVVSPLLARLSILHHIRVSRLAASKMIKVMMYDAIPTQKLSFSYISYLSFLSFDIHMRKQHYSLLQEESRREGLTSPLFYA